MFRSKITLRYETARLTTALFDNSIVVDYTDVDFLPHGGEPSPDLLVENRMYTA